MSDQGKRRRKLQKRLRLLRERNGYGSCWVCGSQSGVKAGREGFLVRCRSCEHSDAHTDDTRAYLKARLQLQKSLTRQ